jgi:hypothetical protein
MNLSEIIGSATTSFYNYVKSGGKIVDAQVRKERLEICHSCEKFIGGWQICKECKCFMKIKTMLPDSSCPLGLWDKSSKIESETNKDIPVEFKCGSCDKTE